MRPGFSLLDVNNRSGGCKQDDLSYMSKYYMMGSFLFWRINLNSWRWEYVDWPLADCELLQPTTESACKISCVHNCYCAIVIFQQLEYYDGTERSWKKELPLSHGRLSTAMQLKEKFYSRT